MNIVDFKEIIEYHLNTNRYSQAEFARQLGCTPDQFSKWLNGDRKIPYDVVCKICDKLVVDKEQQIELFDLAGFPLPQWVLQLVKRSSGSLELSDIIEIVNEHFLRWRRSSHSSRGKAIIKYEQFLQVNTFRTDLEQLSKDQLAFLMRCAVQHGLGGEWGQWLYSNKFNEKIVPLLVLALTGRNGWRPAWRSAYILEVIFGSKIKNIIEDVDASLLKREDINFIISVIETVGIINFLRSVEQQKAHEKKEEAAFLLEEIEEFSKDIRKFAGSQTIAAVYLKV